MARTEAVSSLTAFDTRAAEELLQPKSHQRAILFRRVLNSLNFKTSTNLQIPIYVRILNLKAAITNLATGEVTRPIVSEITCNKIKQNDHQFDAPLFTIMLQQSSSCELNEVKGKKGKASSLDIAPLTVLNSGALQPRKWQLTGNDCSTAAHAVAAQSPR